LKRLRSDELANALAAKRALLALAPRRSTTRPWGQWHQSHDGRDLRRHGLHVLGVGVGRKIVAGAPTDELSVRLYVSRKLPRRQLRAKNTLPKRIAGIPTDVIESSVAYFAASAKCSLQRLRAQRPLRPGISAANERVPAGTLGAICRSLRPGEGADRFVLSNNHVLADFGRADLGSAILQPSSFEGGQVTETIAALHRFAIIDEAPSAANRVDAAIARMGPGIDFTTDICGVGAIGGVATARADLIVHKHGRTSGYSAGRIDDPSIDVVIPLPRNGTEVPVRFVDQIRIVPHGNFTLFAQPGDSGALVATRSSGRAVGLLFACPRLGGFAYANPIAEVLAALGIALL
jgi:hypothetical protein